MSDIVAIDILMITHLVDSDFIYDKWILKTLPLLLIQPCIFHDLIVGLLRQAESCLFNSLVLLGTRNLADRGKLCFAYVFGKQFNVGMCYQSLNFIFLLLRLFQGFGFFRHLWEGSFVFDLTKYLLWLISRHINYSRFYLIDWFL